MKCPRCNGPIIRNQDQYEVYLSCLNCGYEPRITPLAEWYIKNTPVPTDKVYKRGSKAPATRVYE